MVEMMKQVMKRAWEIAKTGVNKFGGKVREYFAISLSIAWKEIKKMSNNVVASFEKIDGKAKIVVTANDRGGLTLAINGEEFQTEPTLKGGKWGYLVRSNEAAQIMSELSGFEVKKVVLFGDESAEHAKVKADQIRFEQLSADDTMRTMVRYGSNYPITFSCCMEAESLKEVHELMTKNRKDLEKIFKAIGGKVEYFTGGYHLSIKKSQLEELTGMLKQEEQLRLERVATKNAEKDAKRAALIEKARETGEPQVLYTYTVDCPDDNEDCSFDSVTVTIDADGKIEKTQSHCW